VTCAGEHRRLAAGRRAEIESPLALARTDDESSELGAAALRPDPPLGERRFVDTLDPIGAGNLGRLAVDLSSDQPHRRFRRLVLRTHQGQRLLTAEVARPDLFDPVRVGELERALGQRLEQRPDPVCDPAEDRVRERDRPFQPSASHKLDGLVDGGMTRRLHEAELVSAEPQRRPHRRVELAHRTPAELLDRVIERAHTLDRPVGEPLGKGAVALVETLDRGW
jgi:hypothetical protein